jgi:hypothetical protein
MGSLKSFGSNPSNADFAANREIQGGMSTSPTTLRNMIYLQEKANNAAIAAHNRDVAASSGKVAARAPKGEFAAPTKIMREVVQERFGSYIDDAVKNGLADDPKVKARFENDPDRGIGPGVYDKLVEEAKARLGAKS